MPKNHNAKKISDRFLGMKLCLLWAEFAFRCSNFFQTLVINTLNMHFSYKGLAGMQMKKIGNLYVIVDILRFS